ncbi:hypothetical protein [Terrisporobacter mayombei]|uniref:Uncharacterized protein n=1 Tax=Terrisporobacter mayombei TaxID=1541 RepID=A0ABY9PWJ7_9FIRM|nr:hypothetical protein [Terrisporobacter mayombei]MCC3867924.1 hypothetical protein [Terrisporobacter mayombei]WMT80058.1 hypothetical protein TEMA_03320 [Terrisporobacter mayombei]
MSKEIIIGIIFVVALFGIFSFGTKYVENPQPQKIEERIEDNLHSTNKNEPFGFELVSENNNEKEKEFLNIYRGTIIEYLTNNGVELEDLWIAVYYDGLNKGKPHILLKIRTYNNEDKKNLIENLFAKENLDMLFSGSNYDVRLSSIDNYNTK